MKGTNALVLNEVTMIEVLQFWLDSKTVNPAPRVTGVKHDPMDETFTVVLDADAPR